MVIWGRIKLSTPSYLILPHLTTPYPVAPACILLPSYLTSNPVLLYPTPSNHILPRPTLDSSAILSYPISPYTVFYHHFLPTSSYTILPHLITSYIILHWPSYLILPHLTTSYPVAPACILLPSYLTSNPVLLYPTPSNHILPRPTLDSSAILSYPTPPYTVFYYHFLPTSSYTILPHLITSYIILHWPSYLILPYLTTSYPLAPS